MKNGIYESTFTTNVGNLGKGTILINRNLFVGADALHFYRGEIDRSDGELNVLMEVTRHNFAADSPLGRDPIFTLNWSGTSLGNETFKLSCEPAGSGVRIYASGTLLKAFE
ncbi:GrlR family regulatory protein [Variovorax sp. Sphag1AA]|uniref:GrlR family regulatory protein n=1 Tax=Variovorax sp. Sphag1AA TaxID=2587027 RepID=UPI001613E781|nr:GrlR family regulatory protein [Variovorax sp. Sphag1AA]MBB3178074.1 hypothetical protein [Variovorax sp. Sphag1AA]MBO9651119.1 hypothetical protein [Variovorax sp.]